MVDEPTSDFQKRRARGETIMNDCRNIRTVMTAFPRSDVTSTRRIRYNSTGLTKEWVKFQLSGTNLSYHKKDFLSFHINNFDYETRREVLYPGPGAGVLANLGQAALTSAYAEASSSDAMYLVTLAEASKSFKTAGELLNLGGELLQFTKKVRKHLRHGILKVGRLPTALAEQWLRYRYGFMQLYYDYQSLHNALNLEQRRLRFTSRRSTTKLSEQHIDASDLYHVGSTDFSRTRTDKFHAGVLVKPTAPALRLWADLGLDKPLSTIWELTPLSFVVDWFVNVGEAISAWEGRVDQHVVGSWLTHTVEMSTRCLYWRSGITTVDPQSGYTYSGEDVAHNLPGYEFVRDITRTANPRWVPIPSIRINLNWKRFLDLASLLTTAANRLR